MSERPKDGVDPDATVMLPPGGTGPQPDADATVMIPGHRPDDDATVMMPAQRADDVTPNRRVYSASFLRLRTGL